MRGGEGEKWKGGEWEGNGKEGPGRGNKRESQCMQVVLFVPPTMPTLVPHPISVHHIPPVPALAVSRTDLYVSSSRGLSDEARPVRAKAVFLCQGCAISPMKHCQSVLFDVRQKAKSRRKTKTEKQ